jgi:hypothetical protein
VCETESVEDVVSTCFVFLLLPFFYLALGSIFALDFNAFNVFSFIVFYVFVLINQMLENTLLRIPSNNFEISKSFILGLEVLNAGVILYFGFQYSWLAALVLLFYTLIIQIQFVFNYYDLEGVAVFVVTLLKLVLLNGFAFYVQANFIHSRYIPVYFGLFIPFYLFEISRTDRALKNVWLLGIIALGYSFGIFFLWRYLEWQSLFLLLSLPFVGLFRLEFSRKTSAIFAYVFVLMYIGLSLFIVVS